MKSEIVWSEGDRCWELHLSGDRPSTIRADTRPKLLEEALEALHLMAERTAVKSAIVDALVRLEDRDSVPWEEALQDAVSSASRAAGDASEAIQEVLMCYARAEFEHQDPPPSGKYAKELRQVKADYEELARLRARVAELEAEHSPTDGSSEAGAAAR